MGKTILLKNVGQLPIETYIYSSKKNKTDLYVYERLTDYEKTPNTQYRLVDKEDLTNLNIRKMNNLNNAIFLSSYMGDILDLNDYKEEELNRILYKVNFNKLRYDTSFIDYLKICDLEFDKYFRLVSIREDLDYIIEEDILCSEYIKIIDKEK